MEEGEFQKVGKSQEKMYGPRRLLVCGYPPEDHTSFLSFLTTLGFSDLPVIFATEEDRQVPVGTLFNREDREGFGQTSEMHRAVVLSGFTHSDLHKLIAGYRQCQLPDQLWATLTPISEKWPLANLLEELSKEAQAMRRLKGRKEMPKD
jgi:hypothetical protein